MGEFELNEIRGYCWKGDHQDKKLPLIIGLGFNGYATFKHLGEYFMDQGFIVITFDFPGFGVSSFQENVSWDFFSKQIHNIYQKFRTPANKMLLISHSMSGIMALHYIQQFSESVLGYCSMEGNCQPGGGYLSKKFARMPEKRLERFFELFVKQTAKDPVQQGLSSEYLESLQQTNARTMQYYSDLLVNHVPVELFSQASQKITHKSFLYAPGSPEGDDLVKLYEQQNYLIYAVEDALHDLINSQPDKVNQWMKNWIGEILKNESR